MVVTKETRENVHCFKFLEAIIFRFQLITLNAAKIEALEKRMQLADK